MGSIEATGPISLMIRIEICIITLENCLIIPAKVNQRYYRPINYAQGIYPTERVYVYLKICTRTCIAVLVIIAKVEATKECK